VVKSISGAVFLLFLGSIFTSFAVTLTTHLAARPVGFSFPVHQGVLDLEGFGHLTK
jgi:hypothetical protein